MALPTEDEIKKQFPTLYNSLHNIPELWQILVWATVTGMSAEQTDAAIQSSQYVRTHTLAQRQWDILRSVDPGSANQKILEAGRAVRMAAARIGANLLDWQVQAIAGEAAANGYKTNEELQDRIVLYTSEQAAAHHGDNLPGQFSETMARVRQIAGEYAMPVDSKEVITLARNMLMSGQGATEDSIRGIFAKRAESLYPSLKGQLQAGMTVKQWAQPYIAVAAQQLEISPDAINLADPKWKAILEGTPTNNKDGTHDARTMTLSEWQAKIRQESKYGYDKTIGAKEQAAQMETELLKRFGGI